MLPKLLFAVFAVLMGSVFAETIGDNPDDPFERERFEKEKLTTQTITMDLTTVGLKDSEIDKNASVRIEYQPMHDEARIYYECMYVTYDRGEAMNTVLEVLADFQIEHKYIGYKYLRDDKEKYFKDDRNRRKAQYISYVKFTR